MLEGGSLEPLIVNWPGVSPAGKVCDDMIDSTDFVPTFAELAGAKLPEGKTIDGHSFAAQMRGEKRQLEKIPTVKQNRIVLVDADSVCYIRSEGHYTWVQTAQGNHFCNLAIGDLEDRLDPGTFLRVHRSYIANLEHAEQIVRDDGRLSLKLRGDSNALPVSRTSVPRLLERLGIAEIESPR